MLIESGSNSKSDNIRLEEKWREWYPKVYGYFYSRVNTRFEVEELTANTMNTVFMAKNVKNFQAYTWKVSHNYLVKYIQTKSTNPMIVGLDDWDEVSSSYVFKLDEEAENITAQNFQDKFSNLKSCIQNQIKNEIEKTLIQLCVYEEKNSTEVASILNLKADNIRQKLSRTLKKIKNKCRELWPAKSNNFNS